MGGEKPARGTMFRGEWRRGKSFKKPEQQNLIKYNWSRGQNERGKDQRLHEIKGSTLRQERKKEEKEWEANVKPKQQVVWGKKGKENEKKIKPG